jgi:hypothetical protein
MQKVQAERAKADLASCPFARPTLSAISDNLGVYLEPDSTDCDLRYSS